MTAAELKARFPHMSESTLRKTLGTSKMFSCGDRVNHANMGSGVFECYHACGETCWVKFDASGETVCVSKYYVVPEETSTIDTDTREKQIQQEIEDWLKSLRPHCYFVRSRMDRATTTPVGTCDFLGWMNGKPFALECKRKNRKPTMEQLAALKMAESAGAIAAVVHSLKEAQAVIGHLEHLP